MIWSTMDLRCILWGLLLGPGTCVVILLGANSFMNYVFVLKVLSFNLHWRGNVLYISFCLYYLFFSVEVAPFCVFVGLVGWLFPIKRNKSLITCFLGLFLSFTLSILDVRLKAAGIRCPTPHLLRLHILVMEFIGITFVLKFENIIWRYCDQCD